MKHAKEKQFRYKTALIIVGSFLAVLLLAYGGVAYYFSTHFGFYTSINNEECAYKTVAEVEQSISDRLVDYSMTVEGRDSLSKTIVAEDIGLSYVSDGQVQAVLDSQNPLLWITRLFKGSTEVSTKASVVVDPDLLKKTIDRLDFFNKKKMRLPVDAYVEFVDSQYLVHPEDLGSTLDEKKTRDLIHEELLTLAAGIDLDKAECYTSPKVYSDNAELLEQVATFNEYVPFSITYTFGEKVEVLDAFTTMDWLVPDEEDNMTMSDELLRAWVRNFGIAHDTSQTKRSFKPYAAEEEITVEGGTYGWEVDENAEIEAIWKAFTNHTGEVRDPYYVATAAEHVEPGKPDWGDTYIELDIGNQHMYYLVDGELVFEADVVTGSPWVGRATPTGAWSILDMLSPTVLKGEIQADGKPEYETRVSYWMRMTWAGHGFHDANWQPWFGGDRYTYAGSHGCINMAYSDAKELYELVEVGTPVISHR